MHFKFVAHDPSSTRMVEIGNFLPIQFWDKIRDLGSLDIRLQSEKTRHRLVEIKNSPFFIHDQHSIFNRIEQGLKETSLARQPLNDTLQSFPVQARNAPEHFIEKTGFCGHL